MHLSLRTLVFVLSALPLAARAEGWDQPRKGTNFFNVEEKPEHFEAVRALGIQLVRLTFSKWKPTTKGAKEGTFLFDSLDEFKTIPEGDLARLKEVLTYAEQNGIQVVLTPLSLPGSIWRQHHGDQNDGRIWKDTRFHDQAASFWKQLARALKGHKAIAAYTIRNEPEPEVLKPRAPDWTDRKAYQAWCKEIAGTARDLNLLYKKTVAAIRSEDPSTPIVLEPGNYAYPPSFDCLKPSRDTNVIYSFHMYEPWEFSSSKNKGRYSYPGPVPYGEGEVKSSKHWNRQALEAFLQPVVEFAARHQIPAHRIYASEFGCYRKNKGCAEYLRDVIEILNAKGWHWSFYSFREDEWDGMDYEMGPTRGMSEAYWKKNAAGFYPSRTEFYPKQNPLWEILRSQFRPQPKPKKD